MLDWELVPEEAVGEKKRGFGWRARALKDRRNVKKTGGYRYAGEVKQNRNETVKRRFDGTSIKAWDDGRRENLFVRNSSSCWARSFVLDYQSQCAETIVWKNVGPLKRELWIRPTNSYDYSNWTGACNYTSRFSRSRVFIASHTSND